jgi:CHAT domain-containing protein
MAATRRSACAAIESMLAALLLCSACDNARPPSAASARAGSDAAAPATPIAPGESVSGQLGGSEHHDYRATLAAGQLLAWTVQQHGMNLRIQAFAPDGTRLLNEDYDREPDGREAQLLVAAKDGGYIISVTGKGSEGDRGSYDLVVAPLKTPTAAERALAEALVLDEHARKLEDSTKREDRQAAIALDQDLVQRFEALGEQRRRAGDLMDLGTVYEDLGDLGNARASFLRAQQLYEAEHYRPGIASTLLNLANAAYYRGDILEALRLDQQALVLLTAIHDRPALAGTLMNIGVFHAMLDDPQAQLEYAQQALAMWEALHDRYHETLELIDLSDAYHVLRDAQSALDALSRAVAIGGDALDDSQRAFIEQNQGLVYMDELQQDDVALEHFRKALALRERMGDEAGSVRTLATMAAAYEDLGQHEAAIDNARRALVRARKMSYQPMVGDLLARLGTSELAAGRLDEARAALDESLALAQKNRSPSHEAMARDGLARIWRQRGDLARARREIEHALTIAESARARVEPTDLRTGYFSRYSRHYDLYVDLLLGEGRPADVAKAFTMHERSRARTLLELLAATRTQLDRDVAPQLLTARDEAQRVVKARELQYRKLIDGAASGTELRAAEQALATAMRAHEAAEAKVRALAPRNAAFSEGNATVAELQALLPADTVLLEYALGDERSHLWWLTAHSLDVTTLAPRAQIEIAARRYYELVTTRSHAAGDTHPEAGKARIADADRASAEAAQTLAQLLLGPVAERLAGQRLIIVPDGALEYVPFAALPVSGPRMLLEDHELSSLPSASVLLALSRRAHAGARATPRVAVFADPVFDAHDPRVGRHAALSPSPSPLLALRSASDVGLAGFRRLRFSRAEAEAIAALTPPGSRVALDFAAARTGLGDLRDFDIVHFATHGILNSRHAELSGLVLSLVNQSGDPIDGFLRLHDIYELDLNAELVVLSACESALGKEISGEGLVGLTHGFMYAGAQRVLASLWQIDDRSTAELFATFYTKLLREGARPGAALRGAQLALAHSSARSAPFYWAPFVLQGALD